MAPKLSFKPRRKSKRPVTWADEATLTFAQLCGLLGCGKVYVTSMVSRGQFVPGSKQHGHYTPRDYAHILLLRDLFQASAHLPRNNRNGQNRQILSAALAKLDDLIDSTVATGKVSDDCVFAVSRIGSASEAVTKFDLTTLVTKHLLKLRPAGLNP